MSFFKTIKDSIYNPEFYSANANVSAKKAFGYFFKLILISALILTIIYGIIYIPKVAFFLSPSNVESMIKMYPQDLAVTIKDGHASTNVKEPYIVAFPALPKSSASVASAQPKNLVVIDTVDDFSMDAFAKADTAIMLTKDYLISRRDSTGQISVQKLQSMPNVVIDRAKISDWAGKIQPYLFIFIPLMMIGMYIGLFVALTASNLFFLLIISLIGMLIAAIRKMPLKYGQTYKLGLYLITSVILVDIIFAIFSIHIAWYISILIYILVFINNIKIVRSQTK